MKYFWVEENEYQTQCSQSQKTECSTSYKTQCSTKTQTTYETQCTTETVEEPIETCTTPLQEVCITATETSYSQQCSTSYATKCYRARNKRGTKKNRETTESSSTSSVTCHKVPQQSCKKVPVAGKVEKCTKSKGEKSCTLSSKSKDVETCAKVPVESHRPLNIYRP